MQKLYVFYRSPIVKYTGSCISFASLLLLYSYVAIFGYRFQYQTAEIVLYVWIAILILEECRQVIFWIFEGASKTPKNSHREHPNAAKNPNP